MMTVRVFYKSQGRRSHMIIGGILKEDWESGTEVPQRCSGVQGRSPPEA